MARRTITAIVLTGLLVLVPTGSAFAGPDDLGCVKTPISSHHICVG